jgi:hypothetical protein
MVESLGEIRNLGADWVAIHPYAGVRQDGTVRFRRAAQTGYLERAVEIARVANVELFWKPHLAYWGSFDWRGDIQFGDDQEAWQRFFDGYREFILDQARFAESSGVRLLAVGVEYEKTTGHEAQWRRIIADVRQVFSGQLTYAANWDSIEKVPFWDALDLIGVHAYYPLSQEQDADWQTLWSGWDEPLRQLRDFSAKNGGKSVLFAEIGYNRSREAAREPWSEIMKDSPASRILRQRLIEVALDRIERTDFVVGMFWWKWIPGPDAWDRDFSMKDPEARAALARYWAKPATEQEAR